MFRGNFSRTSTIHPGIFLGRAPWSDSVSLHIFLRSSDKWYFVYSLGSKVNCHKMSQHGNNRTSVWIETQKLKTLRKLNTWWFKTISVFEISEYFYKMWVWNTIFRTGIKRNKAFVFQGNIAVLQKIRNNIDSVNDNATRE